MQLAIPTDPQPVKFVIAIRNASCLPMLLRLPFEFLVEPYCFFHPMIHAEENTSFPSQPLGQNPVILKERGE